MKRSDQPAIRLLACLAIAVASTALGTSPAADVPLAQAFDAPSDAARPWVYWYFMDGNLNREGMTADLESMKKAGIGGGIFLEVNLGIPRGPVGFMSPEWRELLKHAGKEAERLGLQLALGSGPGWCGTGGPWVKPEQSMQHLVASETKLKGPLHFEGQLPQPPPRTPFFGEKTLTPALRKIWKEFYRDVAVVAYPTPAGNYQIPDVNEKALYQRAPYSSKDGVKPRLTADATVLPLEQCVPLDKVVELTAKLGKDGKLVWDVPPGDWTVMRLGRTITGQVTRPAPEPGLGLESDKFDKGSLDAHFANFVGSLLKTTGEPKRDGTGFTTMHFDSWEMSSQNWSVRFREQFREKRGYDPLPYLPAMFGHPVGGVEIAERFLWDLRRTAQQLVLENHLMHLKGLAASHGLAFSSEPYDMNPAGDLYCGSVADVPMCEFWSLPNGFHTDYSCFGSVSAAHTNGRNIVGAEAFTSNLDRWKQYPWSMKQQGDWALCNGINRFVFHRFQAQPTLDEAPGMTFGLHHGVHWERTQTWWSMADGYHGYLTRCQTMLRRGLPVAEILYLDGEGAPDVFTQPPSATLPGLPDRKGYNFDGCSPDTLISRAIAKDGLIVFPDGMSYRLLVLPRVTAMTPELLTKIRELAAGGVTVVGSVPAKSPGLSGYPACDAACAKLAAEITREKSVVADTASPGQFYPDYDATARILAGKGVVPDFEADADLRYVHRHDQDAEIYFVGNRTTTDVSAKVTFRVSGLVPELWDPVSGTRRPLPEFSEAGGRTTVPLKFAASQSFFIVFAKGARAAGNNFPDQATALEIAGPWNVAFDAKRGGPEQAVTFESLRDWTTFPEEGIKHYSGTAIYQKSFDAPSMAAKPATISLGTVNHMARVVLNARDLGVVWCAPWSVEVPAGLLKATGNDLRINVANLWSNRLIGDAALPAGKRIAKTTWFAYKPNEPLLPSGLLGPVRLVAPR